MKVAVKNYTFNKTSKTIAFDDYNSISLDEVLLVTNVAANTIIYNFAIPNLGGVVTGNILTLDYDTSSMNDNDPLMIYYDDPNVSPATDEMISLLKLLRKQLESNAVVDRNSRQRVTLDAIQLAATGTTTELAGYMPTAPLGYSSLLSSAMVVAPPYASATTVYPIAVWEGPVDQRWRVMEDSHVSYQLGIRNKLTFS